MSLKEANDVALSAKTHSEALIAADSCQHIVTISNKRSSSLRSVALYVRSAGRKKEIAVSAPADGSSRSVHSAFATIGKIDRNGKSVKQFGLTKLLPTCKCEIVSTTVFRDGSYNAKTEKLSVTNAIQVP